jgi:hypothetical protein
MAERYREERGGKVRELAVKWLFHEQNEREKRQNTNSGCFRGAELGRGTVKKLRRIRESQAEVNTPHVQLF